MFGFLLRFVFFALLQLFFYGFNALALGFLLRFVFFELLQLFFYGFNALALGFLLRFVFFALFQLFFQSFNALAVVELLDVIEIVSQSPLGAGGGNRGGGHAPCHGHFVNPGNLVLVRGGRKLHMVIGAQMGTLDRPLAQAESTARGGAHQHHLACGAVFHGQHMPARGA